MQQILTTAQIILAVILILNILVQGRGGGLNRSFMGASNSFTRRGLEKIVFKSTFVVVALFVFVSILQLAL